jgi:HEAT repeat protein
MDDPVDGKRALDKMAANLRLSERGCLLIVTSPDAVADRAVSDMLRVWINGASDCVEFFLEADPVENLSLAKRLRALPEPQRKSALFVFGLDALAPDARATCIESLNWGRDRLAWEGYSVILWTRPETVAELMLRAPDFFSWRSGVFNFDVPSEPQARNKYFATLRTFAPPAPLAETRRRYLDYVIESFRWLEFRGLLQLRSVVRLPLADVFVPLRATGRERVARPDFDAERFHAEDRAPDEGGDARRFRPAFERMTFQTVEAPLHEVVARARRVVVLGDPGSGKSTALRFLALAFAEGTQGAFGLTDAADARRLPILVPLSAFAEARRAQPDLPIAEFLPRHFSETLKVGDFSALFADALRTGDAAVFLDGLDEMLTFDDRTAALRAVAEFAARHPSVRVIVSSRIAGYVGGALPGDFETVTLAPFDRPAIETFAKNWGRAFEAAGADAVSEVARERGDKRGAGLAAAILENSNVERLATNPLMLTLLALIHHQGTRLPNRRVELYRLCVEALAETWNLARSLSGKAVAVSFADRRIDENFVVRTLGPVAFWMHEHRPTGVITREELEAKLAAHFQDEGDAPDRAAALAREFADLAREQLGLLVERAPDEFRFLHLTIEEYLTARHVIAQGEEELMRAVHRRRHHPRWQEPIQLALAFLSGSSGATAGRVIKTAILADDKHDKEAKRRRFKPSRYEAVLHRDLIFAVACLADCVGVPRDIRSEIVSGFTTLYLSLHGKNSNEELREKILTGFARLGKSDAPHDAVPALAAALRDPEKYVRARAADALGKLGNSSPDVISALIAALRDSDSDVRASAADALGKLGNSSPDVISALIAALRDSEWHVRARAADALGKLGNSSPDVISALIAALRDPDSNVRASAADALGKLGNSSPDVISALIAALRDPDSNVRARAADALGKLGNSSPDVISALIAALRDSEWHVRASAAQTLAELCANDKTLAQADLENLAQAIRKTLHASLRENSYGFFSFREKNFSTVYEGVWDALWTICQALEERRADLN